MATARALRDAYRDLVVAVLRDGVDAGVFVPGDARLRSLQMFGSLHWMWTWFDPAGRLPPAEVAAEFCRTLLRGLGVGEDAVRRPDPRAGRPVRRGGVRSARVEQIVLQHRFLLTCAERTSRRPADVLDPRLGLLGGEAGHELARTPGRRAR